MTLAVPVQALAALETAARLREAAEIARTQAEFGRKRAAATQAAAEAEYAEARQMRSEIQARPRYHHAGLLQREAKVQETEAAVFDREAERLVSQARTAEGRARAFG
jgi:hypothetical protein